MSDAINQKTSITNHKKSNDSVIKITICQLTILFFAYIVVLYCLSVTRRYPTQLLATERMSTVYKLKNDTFQAQCRRQIRILKLYYGNHLQLPIDNVSKDASMNRLTNSQTHRLRDA